MSGLPFGFIMIAGASILAGARPFIKRYIKRKRVNEELDGRFMIYDSMIAAFNPYYRSLSEVQKREFVKRTIEFRETKMFRFVDMEVDETMGLMVSTAATQISFGLDDYLMEHFQFIYIVPRDYSVGEERIMYEGHVQGNSIFISWQHFMKGYEIHDDAHNVGLHEMAHALFISTYSEENPTRLQKRFREFAHLAIPLYEKLRADGHDFINEYGYTDYHEFWAVSIEAFFEQPGQFRSELPQLYDGLCELLGQDPYKKIVYRHC